MLVLSKVFVVGSSEGGGVRGNGSVAKRRREAISVGLGSVDREGCVGRAFDENILPARSSESGGGGGPSPNVRCGN